MRTGHVVRAATATLTALVWVSCGGAQAQDFEMRRPDQPPANAQIIGGRPSNLGDWPATLIVTDSSRRNCTATVVGPRVILTAAHCVRSQARGTVRWGNTVGVTCTRHPSYRGGRAFDLALCLSDAELRFPRGEGPERLPKEPLIPATNAELLLQGYGCRRVGGDGPAGVLYEGEAYVRGLSDQEPLLITSGGAAVCFGDSGGAAFQETGLRRVVIAVNARGDIVERSWLTPVGHASIRAFIDVWMTQNGVEICGLSDLEQCHA